MKKVIVLILMMISLLASQAFADTMPTQKPQQRRSRVEMRANLNASNQLARKIGEMKVQNGRSYQSAKELIKYALKNSDTLTGDQIVTLKEQLTQLKQTREMMKQQNEVVMGIRNRLRTLRMEEKIPEATLVVEELIAAQKEMVRLLELTEKLFFNIVDTLEQ